jgi:FMN reductase
MGREAMNDGNSGGIRIVAVLGTARPENYTSKALALVIDEIGKHENIALDLIDPAAQDLPFPGADPDSAETKALQDMVSGATGVIFSTPEYHGSFSSMAKLIIENLGFPSVLAGKPVALVGVAAGRIGAIKALEHLRSVLSHIGAVVLPGPVSVAGVQQVFDDKGRCLDENIETLVRGVATNLIDYINSNICPRMALERMVREN